MYLKPVLQLVITQTLRSFLIGSVHIKHNDCFQCVDDNEVSDHQIDLGVLCQGQICLKYV